MELFDYLPENLKLERGVTTGMVSIDDLNRARLDDAILYCFIEVRQVRATGTYINQSL